MLCQPARLAWDKTMTDPVPPPANDAASRLPRRTTPTWEVELLISGVAIFAMLQLPGWLDSRFFDLRARLDSEWNQLLILLYVYLMCGALTLAATFAIHLLLRAQWIAIVGMHSVFPGGIRWDRLRIGPIQREIEAAHYRDAGTAIDRADNRATVVFAVGVTLATTFLLICVMVVLLFGLIVAVEAILGIPLQVGTALACLFIAVVAPLFVAGLVDRRFGGRLRRDGVGARALAGLFRAYGRLGLSQRASNPTFSLLSSHAGDRRMQAVTVLLMGAVVLAVAVALVANTNPRFPGNYAALPQFADARNTLAGAHYDDERDPLQDAVAFIPSAIATGPYLRLTVPYVPARDSKALRDCTGPATDAAVDADRALACLRRMHAVSLDGKPLEPVPYEIGGDPRSDRPALVAMIDIRALAPGRHELQVTRTGAKQGENADPDGKDAPSWRIPFWR
jgi:hypothetical protein